jgi:hypothetical protein
MRHRNQFVAGFVGNSYHQVTPASLVLLDSKSVTEAAAGDPGARKWDQPDQAMGDWLHERLSERTQHKRPNDANLSVC